MTRTIAANDVIVFIVIVVAIARASPLCQKYWTAPTTFHCRHCRWITTRKCVFDRARDDVALYEDVNGYGGNDEDEDKGRGPDQGQG